MSSDESSRATIEESTKTGVRAWFDRFNAIVESGVLAELSRLELAVLLVLLKHSDNATGYTRVGVEKISKLIRYPNLNRIREALAGLDAKGVTRVVEPGGGRERPNVREVLLVRNRDSVCPRKNRDSSAPKQGQFCAGNRDSFAPETGTACVPRSTSVSTHSSTQHQHQPSTQHQHQQGGSAAGGGDAEVGGGEEEESQEAKAQRLRDAEEALLTFRINNPTRDTLLKIPGLTAGVVEIVYRNKSPTAGTGVFISNLKAEAPRLIAAEQERRREERALRELEQLDTARAEQAIAGLNDDDAVELWAVYGPHVTRRVVEPASAADENGFVRRALTQEDIDFIEERGSDVASLRADGRLAAAARDAIAVHGTVDAALADVRERRQAREAAAAERTKQQAAQEAEQEKARQREAERRRRAAEERERKEREQAAEAEARRRAVRELKARYDWDAVTSAFYQQFPALREVHRTLRQRAPELIDLEILDAIQAGKLDVTARVPERHLTGRRYNKPNAEQRGEFPEAREALAEHGLVFTNRLGEPRARPEAAIARTAQVTFARMLRELALDVADPGDSRPPTIAPRRP